MYNFEAVLTHFPATATCHEETESYLVKWEGYRSHPKHTVIADKLFEDVPEHVMAYWEDLAAEPIEPPAEPPDPEAPSLHASVAEPLEPATYAQAKASPHFEQWQKATDEEYESLMSNDTWEIVQLPPGAKVLGSKWVFKLKRGPTGAIERFKARFVVKGYLQEQGLDFDEVFAPTGRHASFRMLMALAAAGNWELAQIDIKTAFLNGDMDTDVYVEQPKGYEIPGGGVCRLRKTLYGLKQAPRAWFLKLKEELARLHIYPSSGDPGLFKTILQGAPVYLLIWVDDILLAAKQQAHVAAVKESVMRVFDSRDLGEPKLFVGIQIDRDRAAGTIKLSQRRSIDDIVAHYSLDAAKTRCTPFVQALKLVKDDEHPTDQPYASLVGSLLYLTVCTRPDLSHSVGVLTRFMSAPAQSHWDAACGVVRYLAGTRDLGITFGRESGLLGYADADYGGDTDTRRSTTGFVFILNSGPVSWQSKLQPTVALSTAEAEYMAASAAAREALWLRKLLGDFEIHVDCISIMGDNQAALHMLKHPVASMRSKHIDIMHHFARERMERGEVNFEYVRTDEQLADIFTKQLPQVTFSKLCHAIGVS
jgi:hypothetical protein